MEASEAQEAKDIGPTGPPAPEASSAPDAADSNAEREIKGPLAPPPRKLGPTMPDDIAPPAPKRMKMAQEDEEEEDNFGPSLPTAADVMRVVSAAPTFDPLLGTAPLSAATMGTSLEAPTALTTSEKDAWERLRSDPNATLANLNPTEREEWMLKLPEGQRKTLDYDMMQQSVTSFSRKGTVKHAVDTTWAESPADRAKREASTEAPKSSLELAKQMVAERLAREKAEQTAKMIEEHNSKHRAKSLMEIAAEEKMKQAKEAQDKERRRAERAKEKEKRKSKDKHRKSKDKDKRDKRKRKEKKRKRRDSSSSDSDSDSDSSSSSSSDSRDKKSSKKKSSSTSDPQVAFNPYGFGAGPSAPSSSNAGPAYWDRERDMSSSRFDAVKKQSAIKDSKMLNQKFAPSNASRFM
eukprot:TRINITY_DN5221_c0_g1_i1.p1 TRINITY_DN5221_c0_g1~~TRINITY_DN5221_c0_g1_i1.p1  ORF type:complete len:416 (+),score=117.66 TRINITY_DN5221_c0_g1_i1:26-1249(+)